MADLDSLMTIDGAVAAFRFSSKGELLESRSADGEEFTNTVLDLLSHVCVANMAIATMQARGWENMTGMGGFYPVQGFTMVGFDWTVVVNDEYGVIMPNDKVDYDAAYDALGA
jgi:roadblock/LC7 domain-containing protein